MDWTGIGALVGAAAWIPQIIQWGYKYFSKPQLEVLSTRSVGIGYTAAGPVVHWTIAISAQRKDAVITNITLKVTHENGDSRLLTWGEMEEVTLEFTTGREGESAAFKKSLQVLAIRVTTETLAERIIAFWDAGFYATLLREVDAAKDHYSYLKSQDDNADETLVRTKEFKRPLDFLSKDLFWKEGRYDFEIFVFERNLKRPHHQNFNVLVSRDHIEKLQHNIGVFSKYLQWQILGSETKLDWRLAFPTIVPVKGIDYNRQTVKKDDKK